jgi:hypothetical protein
MKILNMNVFGLVPVSLPYVRLAKSVSKSKGDITLVQDAANGANGF